MVLDECFAQIQSFAHYGQKGGLRSQEQCKSSIGISGCARGIWGRLGAVCAVCSFNGSRCRYQAWVACMPSVKHIEVPAHVEFPAHVGRLIKISAQQCAMFALREALQGLTLTAPGRSNLGYL